MTDHKPTLFRDFEFNQSSFHEFDNIQRLFVLTLLPLRFFKFSVDTLLESPNKVGSLVDFTKEGRAHDRHVRLVQNWGKVLSFKVLSYVSETWILIFILSHTKHLIMNCHFNRTESHHLSTVQVYENLKPYHIRLISKQGRHDLKRFHIQ